MPQVADDQRRILEKYNSLLKEFRAQRRASAPPGEEEQREALLQSISADLERLERAGKKMGIGLEMEHLAALSEPAHPHPQEIVANPANIAQFFRTASQPQRRPDAPTRPPIPQARPTIPTRPSSTPVSQRPSTAQEVREHGTEAFAAMGRDYHRTVDPDGVRRMTSEAGFKRDLIELATLALAAILMVVGTYAQQKIVAHGHRPWG